MKTWVTRAAPLKGIYFRSVEYRYMDPADVLSGDGTKAYGGRFAAIGMRAVYLSATDSGAGKEVTARKARLGGSPQITVSKYPRIVYAVSVNLDRTLHLSSLGSSDAAKTLKAAALPKMISVLQWNSRASSNGRESRAWCSQRRTGRR